MKYKIGDKVKIREDLEKGSCYDSDSSDSYAVIVDLMLSFAGRTTKVAYVDKDHKYYNLSCDGEFWNWPEGALAPIKEEGR